MKTFFLFVFLVSGTYGMAQNRSITFSPITYEQALEKAKATHKIIFIDTYTTWCGPCKQMAQNVFTKDSVADFYNTNFICLSYDLEKGEGPAIKKKFGINAYPTFVFLNSNDEQLLTSEGFRPPDSFISLGKEVLMQHP